MLTNIGGIMGYLEVWGFDPDEAAKAQLRFRAMVEGGRALCGIDEARNAAIPQTIREQIRALETLFRL